MRLFKSGGKHETLTLLFFRLHVVLLSANYQYVDAIFMWTAPTPAWNQTKQGSASADIETVAIPVLNGSTNVIVRWNYTLLSSQALALATFKLGDGINPMDDIGFVSGGNPIVYDRNDYRARFSIGSTNEFSALTIKTLTEREHATYQCLISLQAGSSWAYNIRIEVTVPPRITHISANQTVTEGQNVPLNCTASGYPAPNITWTKLSDNSTVTMPLINIRRQDEGGYRCTADNHIGSPATRDTYIVVHYKPDIVTLAANATENKDCSGVLWVNFICVASEANPPVYNYQLFGNGDLTSLSGTWTQEISEKGKHDYSCLAQHKLGNVTSSKNVTVTFNVPVQISANLITGSNTPRRGEDVALCCNASGFPEPSITWSKVLSNALVEINSSKCLNFTNIKEDKSGMYICQANNTCGKQNSSVISINVLHEPENVILNASISSGKVCAAKMVKFTCKAGAAEPEVDNYALYQNDAVIANMRGYGVFTLWLNTSGHFIYMCKANNSVGTGTSNNITFTVEVPSLVVYINDSIVVREDEDAILFCSASGSPPPSISWVNVKTGVSKEGATLLLTNLTEENQGDVYKCVASNGCGNDSKSTAIDVQHLPKNVKLNLSISDDKVCTGNVVQFTCKAGAANPEVERYTLYQNNTVIANMSSSGVSTLWLNTSGHFIYKCEADNSVATGTSNSISVTVEEGASVTSENGSIVRVKEGENVSLSCIPSGVPLPNVSWSYGGNDMLEFGSTLPIPNISRALNGSAIECSASNACGNDSKATYVVVQYAPENVTLRKDVLSDKVCPGDTVQFTCKAGAANPKVESYTLYRNDTVNTSMGSSGVVRLPLTTPGQFIYRCVAQNSVDNATSNNISVTVRVPLSVTIVHPTTVVKEGENATLTCDVTGDSAPNVSWVDDRNELTNSGSIWKLPNISRELKGEYNCVASNACGKSTKNATIDVQYLYVNRIGGATFSVAIGETVNLTCLADGNPEPNITWYERGDNDANPRAVGKNFRYERKKGSVRCHTCVARSNLGVVNATLCLTFGVVVRITLIITNRDCKEKGLDEKFRVEIENVLAELGIENVTITVRCGSVIVDLVLRFNQTVSEKDVIDTLKTAAGENKFVGFTVDPDSIKVTSDDSEDSSPKHRPCEKSFFKNADCSVNVVHAAAIAAGAVVLIAITAVSVGCWIHKKRKCRKDTRIAHHPGCEGQRLQEDDRYGQVNNGYAETGPPSANSTEKAAAAVPDYTVVDKSAKKKKKKKQDEEKPPEYAVVDKSKQKKKNEKVDDTYAKVDMSKKTSKKKPRPGEDVLYADLGDFNGTSQMPAVATSPKALPPIKKPDAYEGTQYADITQFLKGDATLPKNEKQDDKQPTEMKEKHETADGAGTENAPKETPM